MKLVVVLLSTLFLGFIQQENPKLNGTYRIVFDKKYEQQTFKIVFVDSIYKKIMPDAVMYKGKIKYEKFRAVLRYSSDDNPIEIDNRDFTKDTMKFTTKSKIDASKTISRGLMIKMN
jgi:hypothetical protein